MKDLKSALKSIFRVCKKIDADELDKLALLRVLEVTNGCTQWGFRRQDEQCLSVEQTRECMRQVIGFIQNKQIDLPSGEQIHFAPSIEALIEEGRELYQAAFKKKTLRKKRESILPTPLPSLLSTVATVCRPRWRESNKNLSLYSPRTTFKRDVTISLPISKQCLLKVRCIRASSP